jgi:hypothetical protein
MNPKKVILITKVIVKWDHLEEFNAWWQEYSLPKWIEHGGKHIGSYECYLGNKKNEIMRITEFENLEKFQKWMEWRNTTLYHVEPTSKERAEKVAPVTKHAESLEESVWFSIY